VVGSGCDENHQPPQLVNEQVAGIGETVRRDAYRIMIDDPDQVAEPAGKLFPNPVEISFDEKEWQLKFLKKAKVEPVGRLSEVDAGVAGSQVTDPACFKARAVPENEPEVIDAGEI
jgi:hypothetical protein